MIIEEEVTYWYSDLPKSVDSMLTPKGAHEHKLFEWNLDLDKKMRRQMRKKKEMEERRRREYMARNVYHTKCRVPHDFKVEL